MAHRRAAVITGGASGIGAETVRSLATRDMVVFALDVDDEVEELWATWKDVVPVQADVTSPESLADVRELMGRFPVRLHALVNAAGTPGRSWLTQFDDDDFHRLVAVNLYGVASSMRTFVPLMLSHGGGGSVVNVASMAARRTDKTLGIYSATKAGVISLTRVAALELAADGIRANAVLPGPIDTPMLRSSAQRLLGSRFADVDEVLESYARSVPLGRIGRPDEVAATIAFLISEEASFITGECLGVGGGIHLA